MRNAGTMRVNRAVASWAHALSRRRLNRSGVRYICGEEQTKENCLVSD
jgi:hypothetical protein